MKVLYFSVYDRKLESYGPLFSAPTRGAAERGFGDSLKSDGNTAAKHPEDFALYCVLELDDEVGQVLTNFQPPQLVVEAISLV